MKYFFCVVLIPIACLAQPEKEKIVCGKYAISALYHYGFIIAHRSSVLELQKDHIKAIELNVIRQTLGERSWHEAYHYPEIGLKSYYMDLGNREQLGRAFALIPCLDFNFSNNPDLSFHFNFGIGLGYIEKPFDAKKNFKNIAIGSRLNAAIHLSAGWQQKVFSQTYVQAGLAFNHFSNGSATVPNLGINLPSAYAGFRYYIEPSVSVMPSSAKTFKKEFRNTVYVAGAYKQVYPVNGPGYFAFILSAARVKRLSMKSAFGAGADVHYDQSILYKLETDEQPDVPAIKAMRAGLNLSYELLFSDFSLMFQTGVYAYTKLPSEGRYYNRLGMRYEFYENFFACLNLKTHFAKADFFEVGIGKRF